MAKEHSDIEYQLLVIDAHDGLSIIMATHNEKPGLQTKRVIYLQDGKLISK